MEILTSSSPLISPTCFIISSAFLKYNSPSDETTNFRHMTGRALSNAQSGNDHHDHDLEHSRPGRKSPAVALQRPLPSPGPAGLPPLKFRTNAVAARVPAPCVWLLPLRTTPLRPIQVAALISSWSNFILSSVSWHGHTTIFMSVCQLMGIWVISPFVYFISNTAVKFKCKS